MLKNNDAKAFATALGGCLITAAEAAKKSIFTEAMRLQVGDIITLNVEDEGNNPIWGKDARGGVFVFASLTRGGRTISTYRLYPSMLLRSAVRAQGDRYSDEDKTDRTSNSGLPDYTGGDNIVTWITSIWGFALKVENIRNERIWSIDFAKYNKAKEEKTLPNPLTDDFWQAGDRRFYDFTATTSQSAPVPEPQQQPQQPTEAQPGSSHS